MGPYPLSSLPFDAGFLLLALALFRAAGILQTILGFLKGPRYDLLVQFAALALLGAVALHAYAFTSILPKLTGAPDDPLFVAALQLKNASIACLALAGLLASTATGLCFHKMNS